VTADPELPVPPRLYGGIERVVASLVDALVDRGHGVTLVAHRDSVSRAALVPYPASRSRGKGDTARNAAMLLQTFRSVQPHLVHSFGRLAYLAPILPLQIPKVMSYQRPITRSRVVWAHRLSRGTLTFTGCSAHLIGPVRSTGRWHVVHNSVPTERFACSESVPADAPLAFLGRIEPLKGPHLALDIAAGVGRRLVLAGNVADEHRPFFESEIRPRIDGTRVTYIGEVDDEAKAEMLSGAAALLMPVLWDEPFGIVMAEALACGTPVVGLARGAVPEVIDHGQTGFVCETVDEMAACVARLPELDRTRCRKAAETRFSTTAMVEAYEAVYAEALGADARTASASEHVSTT